MYSLEDLLSQKDQYRYIAEQACYWAAGNFYADFSSSANKTQHNRYCFVCLDNKSKKYSHFYFFNDSVEYMVLFYKIAKKGDFLQFRGVSVSGIYVPFSTHKTYFGGDKDSDEFLKVEIW